MLPMLLSPHLRRLRASAALCTQCARACMCMCTCLCMCTSRPLSPCRSPRPPAAPTSDAWACTPPSLSNCPSCTVAPSTRCCMRRQPAHAPPASHPPPWRCTFHTQACLLAASRHRLPMALGSSSPRKRRALPPGPSTASRCPLRRTAPVTTCGRAWGAAGCRATGSVPSTACMAPCRAPCDACVAGRAGAPPHLAGRIPYKSTHRS